jgi:hypothetical protein
MLINLEKKFSQAISNLETNKTSANTTSDTTFLNKLRTLQDSMDIMEEKHDKTTEKLQLDMQQLESKLHAEVTIEIKQGFQDQKSDMLELN